MYHIPNDKRAKRSAELIYQCLMDSLEKAPLSEISVTGLTGKAGIGRSTFYRLFDNTADVLYWKCEEIMQKALQQASKKGSPDEVFLSFISSWMDHKPLLCAVMHSSLSDVLFQVHVDHIGEIKSLFLKDVPLSYTQEEYLVVLLSAMMATTFKLWDRRPHQEPEEALLSLKDAVHNLDILFNGSSLHSE